MLSVSCTKNKSFDPTIDESTFDVHDFPLQENNEWTYLLKDFYTNETDTLIIRIIDKTFKNDTTAFLCHLYLNNLNNLVDSAVYELNSNSLSYSTQRSDGYSYFGNFILNFPFSESSYWVGAHTPDTVKVIKEEESSRILGKDYKNVFYIKRAYYLGGGYSIVQTLQVSPGFGIVKQNIDLFDGFNAQKQSFELIATNFQ